MDAKVEQTLRDEMGEEDFHIVLKMLEILDTPYKGKVGDRLQNLIEEVADEGRI